MRGCDRNGFEADTYAPSALMSTLSRTFLGAPTFAAFSMARPSRSVFVKYFGDSLSPKKIAELRFDGSEVPHVVVYDFTYLRVALTGSSTHDADDCLHIRVANCLEEHPLADHAGRAEDDDIHRSSARSSAS